MAMRLPEALTAQTGCPGAANPETERGWTAYRTGDMGAAASAFEAALQRCSDHAGALNGRGYVALREGADEVAARSFERVLRQAPDDIDALVGLGIIAWRQPDHLRSREIFERVAELDPANADARDYLERLPPPPAPPPERPPLVRPERVEYPARVQGDYFEIRTADGWEPFFIRGVNLGAALPGKFPSEFPDADTYVKWIGEMAEMKVNTIRLYTIHPPHFYDALRAHNLAHPEAPIWIIHGVWTELPPDHDFEDAEWEREFFAEMRRVVDLLHGRADIAPRPGHAAGYYTADVADWTLAYIIGREWEPYAVDEFNHLPTSAPGWAGRYLHVEGGTPADAWMAKASEEIIAYEMEVYHAQRPVAYTNWPTLDPLHHPTESTVAEEVAIRTALGEVVETAPLEYDNDLVALDANLVKTTEAFPAGYFASYHPYPYYPDFMILDPEFGRAGSSLGRSNYFGYLQALKAHHPGMPVVVAEYGVPASTGSAHLQPQGWHHGGLTEAEMAEINARMTLEIAEAGMAGAIVFAWIDEWFKRNWLVTEFELPEERNRLWLNRLDAEQHYGMIAMEPRAPLPGRTLSERLPHWREVEPLDQAPDGSTFRALADEGYLWLFVEPTVDEQSWDELFVGFDVVDPAAGDFHLPGRVGPRQPVGLEFVLHLTRDSARILVDPPYNPFVIHRIAGSDPTEPIEIDIENPLPGVFYGRYEQRFNRPFRSVANDDGVYEALRVLTNRRRFARDRAEFAAIGYDRGQLPAGPPPDGMWEMTVDGSAAEIRIPWLLLNVTDPSSRSVLLDDPAGDATGAFGVTTIDGIRMVVTVRSGDRWTTLPASGAVADVPLFSWPTWDVPEWTARRRPAFDAMREMFETLETHPLMESSR